MKNSVVFTKKQIAVAVAMGLAFGLTGCGDDKSTSSSVGIPNPNAIAPAGTIQGYLRDSVTQAPIVGAVVDIGVAKAVTTDDGQYVIAGVPATNAPYQITIDLRKVKAVGAFKYPDFAYDATVVGYTTLGDATDGGSNHATPVVNLVTGKNLSVGKLASTIKGVVGDSVTRGAVGAGYVVTLVATASNNSAVAGVGGTGAAGNVVASTTTGAGGAFSFAGVESLHGYVINVVSADGMEFGSVGVTSPADGQTRSLQIQEGTAPLVASVDALAPVVLSSNIENGQEIAPGANVAITFNFSEAIRQTARVKDVSQSNTGGLYSLVDVNFLGAKASNIPHSLSWNTAGTALTVTIPSVVASSRYSVSLVGENGEIGASDVLTDVNGNVLDLSNNRAMVNFTTNGAQTPAAVNRLQVTNAAGLNQWSQPVLDWLPVSGANGYNVYRTTGYLNGAAVVWDDSTGVLPQNGNVLVTTSSYTDDSLDFAIGGLKTVYKYSVRPVSRDGIELATDSNVVQVADVIAPVVSPVFIAAGDTQVQVRFNEPMDKVNVTTLANYVLAATPAASGGPATAPVVPALSAAVYNSAANVVTLTYASGIPAGSTLTVSALKDASGNPIAAPVTSSVEKVAVPSVSGVTAGSTTVRVDFNARMNKASAETVANYSVVVPVTTPVTVAPKITKVECVMAGSDCVEAVVTLDAVLVRGYNFIVAGKIKDAATGAAADGVSVLVP